MVHGVSTRADVLQRAAALAVAHLDGVGVRHVVGRADRRDLLAALGGPLPEGQTDALDVIQTMQQTADPGLVATPGPRYFGFVTGGALPVAVAADWLASAWDQNAALYVMSPATAVMEDVVAGWILDLLRLPATSSVGFVTGAHMATFTCLAAARHEVLRRAGWRVEDDGLQGAPRLTVVIGDQAHVSVVGGLRLLGIGARTLRRVAVDDQGRMQTRELAPLLRNIEGPVIVCAQAGNVSSGASDPMDAIVDAAHARDAWVHVDGAFGLWASAVPELSDQVEGVARADSWTVDCHKWLNVPYDSGLAIVAHPAPHRAAMSLHASYLLRGGDEERVGMDWVPESSRRARVVPIYAVLRSLGRSGVQELVRRNCRLARRMAERLASEPGIRIANDVVLNQVLVQFDGPAGADATTRDVIARIQADGTCWAGGAEWQGRQALRISVSNWSTTENDIDASADAIARCHRESLHAA
jgi:glutamate/tyrosine decarboxylase-like PLP-dependent enzyme